MSSQKPQTMPDSAKAQAAKLMSELTKSGAVKNVESVKSVSAPQHTPKVAETPKYEGRERYRSLSPDKAQQIKPAPQQMAKNITEFARNPPKQAAKSVAQSTPTQGINAKGQYNSIQAAAANSPLNKAQTQAKNTEQQKTVVKQQAPPKKSGKEMEM